MPWCVTHSPILLLLLADSPAVAELVGCYHVCFDSGGSKSAGSATRHGLFERVWRLGPALSHAWPCPPRRPCKVLGQVHVCFQRDQTPHVGLVNFPLPGARCLSSCPLCKSLGTRTVLPLPASPSLIVEANAVVHLAMLCCCSWKLKRGRHDPSVHKVRNQPIPCCAPSRLLPYKRISL